MDEPLVAIEGRAPVQPWPVAWSAVWVGALSAVAVALTIGLIGYAIGAHQYATGGVDWKHMKWGSMIFSVGGAFFSFVAGGWVTARIAGFRRSEPAMLHGAVAWLLTVPFLMILGALHSGSYLGGWYGGLSPVTGTAAADAAMAATVRNASVATVLALLIGLVGAVLGGWMASGEPMTLTHYRRRTVTPERPRRAA